MAGDDGHFTVNAPPGTFALSVASPGGYWTGSVAFSPSTVHVVELNRDCERVSIRVVGDAPPGSLLWFWPIEIPRTYFGAMIDQSALVSACLPSGPYRLYGDDGFDIERTILTLPAGAPSEVFVFKNSTLQAAPAEMPVVHVDPAEFVKRIPNVVDVVALGESNHGTAEFVEMRLELALALSALRGGAAILLEAGAAEVMPLDRYVAGEDIDVRAAVAAMNYWMWDTENFIRALAAIRDYNAGRPQSQHVRLFGIDVQSVKGPVQVLLKNARLLRWKRNERKAVAALESADRKRIRELADEQLAVTRAALQKALDAGVGKRRVDVAFAAQALLSNLAIAFASDADERFALRDQGMAEMVLLFRRLHESSVGVVWAHNAHIASDEVEGLSPMGARLREVLRDRYYSVAILLYEGMTRAWDPEVKIGVIEHQLAPAPEYSVEATLVGDEQPAAFVHFRSAGESFLDWLSIPRYVREFGAQYPGSKEEWNLRALASSYDAAVVIRSGTATVPTATGVRVKN